MVVCPVITGVFRSYGSKDTVKMQDRALVFLLICPILLRFTPHLWPGPVCPGFCFVMSRILSLFLRRHLRFPPTSHSSRSIRYSTRSLIFPCIQTFFFISASSYEIYLSLHVINISLNHLAVNEESDKYITCFIRTVLQVHRCIKE